jgi:PKD repeat protein
MFSVAGIILVLVLVQGVQAAADFSATPTSGPVPLAVTFTDTSTDSPIGWAWFFGDESYTGTWTAQSASALWTAGPGSDSVVLPDGSIVLVRNGVWRSTDQGKLWTQVNPSPGFAAGDTVVMPDGTMLHMNYQDIGGGYQHGEVWQSTDKGTTWTPVTMAANWDPTSHYTYLEDCVALPDGTILLTYYHSMAGEWTAVMRSTDQGVTWTSVVSIPWSPRTNFDLTAMPDGSVIMTGGSNWGGNYNDVWRSTDKGTTWTQQTADAGWTARYDHTSVGMPDGSIVLMGGYGSSIPGRDEVWRSTDNGATWTLLTSNADWPARTGATSVAMPDGSIVLMGGEQTPGFGPYNDAWRLVPTGSSAQNPSHIYTTPGIYQVALQAYDVAGYSSIRKANFIGVGGKAAAVVRGVDDYFGGNPAGNGNQELLVSDNEVPAGTWVTLLDGTKIQSPGYSTWLDFINEHRNANWGHLCEIVFYADGHAPVEHISDMPPTGIDLSHAAGKAPNAAGIISSALPWNPDCVCNPVTTNNYALLISGGGTQSTNYVRYYNDTKFMYNTLVNDFHYDKNHIKVLISDGTNSANDAVYYDASNKAVPVNSNPDLNGDGTNEVSNSATKINVQNALASFNAGTPSAPINLLIFTTGHGAKNIAYSDPSTNQVDLLLWGAGVSISDKDFAAALPANARITMMMEQCYGGGFKNDVIKTSGFTRVLATAARGDQVSHSNDFSYYWITGVAGHDMVGNLFNADKDNSCQVSSTEAFNFANSLDPSGPNKANVENPTFNQYTSAAGSTQFFSACTPTYSINVPKPSAAWIGGQSATVTWTQGSTSLPPGTLVKIELMIGTYPGVPQADFITPNSKAVSLGTATATVPTDLPGGANTNYWIKISTIGGFRPQVVGYSPNFEIKSVTVSKPASLTITTTPSPALGNIWDSSGSTVYINNVAQGVFSTPKTFNPLSKGKYLLQLSYPCYLTQTPTVTVGAGTTQTKPYTLFAMPAGTCNNANVGSIEITSLPIEGFRIYLKKSADTSFINTYWETPTISDVEAGGWTVRLEADGYLSQEKTVTVNAGDVTYVDFTLTKIPDISAQVHILPQPLNIGRTGYFLAIIKLPTGYKAADVMEGSVSCEGASALKLIRLKMFPQIFGAIFKRQDLQTVRPRNQIPMFVVGAIKRSGGNVLFSGSDKVNVISKPVTTKEDIDSVMTMSDTQIFSKFNKF